ncbi:hypothetical protein [Amycolatopsis sp. DG1A-15b]|uniref:hypothetical protein n=1 Tax=Amycolatopsis sp. DG1A-15b TaxID=3052846 RepID=UPI00255B5E88|nr:hypothetical protein [Amycolatopsis sp. DG1A-15b]WIX92578.1 hypothetical protein QRY02_19900 [Amycolatopsis sp. DG1A-15b]
MTTEFDDHCDALILHLHETDSSVADDFLADRGFDFGDTRQLVQDLEERGLVTPTYVLAQTRCTLTGRGVRRAQQLIKERPKRRATTLRYRMLLWLEEHPETENWDAFLASSQAHFEGAAFTEPQLKREAKFLYESGYITAVTIDQEVDGMLYPDLTAAGRDFFYEGGESSGGRFIANTYYGPVINGPVTGSQFAWGNTTASQGQQSAPSDRGADA